MNCLCLVVVLLVILVELSSGQRRRGYQEGPAVEGRGSPTVRPPTERPVRNRRAPPSLLRMFPACQELNQALKQKYEEMCKSKIIGPKSNKCKEERKECMRKDMHTVRCAVADQPSQKCLEDVMNYLQASACETEGDGSVGTGDNWDTVEEP